MTDYFPYFITGGFLVVIIIVFNHKRQKSRLTQFAGDKDDAPQMLLVQSVERKLKSIYSKLYENGVKPKDRSSGSTGPKERLIQELEQLEANYADKKISLKDYSDKLQQLQLKVNKL